MSIKAVRRAIQTHVKTLSGIRRSETVMPDTINTADLPLAVTYTGRGVWTGLTFGEHGNQQTRTYVVRVYVEPIGQGVTDERYTAAEELMQTVAKSFQSASVSGVWKFTEITDSGVMADGRLAWANVPYVGFEVTIKAVQLEAV